MGVLEKVKNAIGCGDELEKIILLPIKFKNLGDFSKLDEEKRRGMVRLQDSKIVMLNDLHIGGGENDYQLGRVFEIKGDPECYNFQIINQDLPIKLHYHDLKGLMIPFPSPTIKAIIET